MNTPAQPRLTRDEVDRSLAALTTSYDRISATMYAVDSHPGAVLLGGEGLTGETARAAARARTLTDLLWSHFAALGTVLELARTVRSQRSRPGDEELAELTVLLRSPVINLGADGMIVDQTGPGPVVDRVTVPDLARRLAAESTEVDRLLASLDAARSWLASRFAPVTEALDRVRADAALLDAGPPVAGSLAAGARVDGALPSGSADRVGAALDEARRAAFADPLTVAGGGPATTALDRTLTELGTQIGALAERLAVLARVRDGYRASADRLSAALVEVASAQAEAGRTYAIALEKIADPGLPALPDAVPALRGHLAALDQFHREGRWARLADELATVERAVPAARERADHLREAADGLLRRRAELRGRLDAYRAKAARLGYIEHTELSTLHRAARDLLYRSPCDLPASTRAVVAYQRHLNDLTERPAPGRRETAQ